MSDAITAAWEAQRAAMGAFIRSQRELGNMSLRELSRATRVSNAYLSQIERGKNDPTLRVLVQISDGLKLTVEEMLKMGAPHRPTGGGVVARGVHDQGVGAAIRADQVLSRAEKDALLSIYESYLGSHEAADARESAPDPEGS